MEIKRYKNEYGYYRVSCPFCSEECYAKEEIGKDTLRDLKRHIVNQAKNEALAYVSEGGEMGKHLSYFKDHASERVKVVTSSKYLFDNDLSFKSEK